MDVIASLNATQQQGMIEHLKQQRRMKRVENNFSADGDHILRKHKLEKYSKALADKLSLKIDPTVKVLQIFECVTSKSPSQNNFTSPRKRFLKYSECDQESPNQGNSKKRSLLTTTTTRSIPNNLSDSCQSFTLGRNLTSKHSSLNCSVPVHSIDSILSGSEKPNESFLKTLLKCEEKQSAHSSSYSPLTSDDIKMERPESVLCLKQDKDDTPVETRSSREYDDRRHQPGLSSSPGHTMSASPSPRTVRSAHLTNRDSAATCHNNTKRTSPHPPYPNYNTPLNPHTLASMYPQFYDSNYMLLNGINPLAAGGIMSNPHNQMAVAAAAAAAAAASISSMSSYGLGQIQLSALAATQYSNLLNSALSPMALAPALAAAAAASPLTPNIAAPLTPALTPGAAALPIPTPINPTSLPSSLTPGISPGLTSHPNFLPSNTPSYSPQSPTRYSRSPQSHLSHFPSSASCSSPSQSLSSRSVNHHSSQSFSQRLSTHHVRQCATSGDGTPYPPPSHYTPPSPYPPPPSSWRPHHSTSPHESTTQGEIYSLLTIPAIDPVFNTIILIPTIKFQSFFGMLNV